MSEYIYAGNGKPLSNAHGEISLARERITRCRDCKHNANGACARWDYCDIDGSNGFCAWAKRKEGGDDSATDNRTTELQEQLNALKAERANLRLDRESWKANYMHMMRQRDDLQAKVNALEAENTELREKLGSERELKSERTCHNAREPHENCFKCSECGRVVWLDEPTSKPVFYCPNCGARRVER